MKVESLESVSFLSYLHFCNLWSSSLLIESTDSMIFIHVDYLLKQPSTSHNLGQSLISHKRRPSSNEYFPTGKCHLGRHSRSRPDRGVGVVVVSIVTLTDQRAPARYAFGTSSPSAPGVLEPLSTWTFCRSQGERSKLVLLTLFSRTQHIMLIDAGALRYTKYLCRERKHFRD